jgi:hypothetical protein
MAIGLKGIRQVFVILCPCMLTAEAEWLSRAMRRKGGELRRGESRAVALDGRTWRVRVR